MQRSNLHTFQKLSDILPKVQNSDKCGNQNNPKEYGNTSFTSSLLKWEEQNNGLLNTPARKCCQ